MLYVILEIVARQSGRHLNVFRPRPVGTLCRETPVYQPKSAKSMPGELKRLLRLSFAVRLLKPHMDFSIETLKADFGFRRAKFPRLRCQLLYIEPFLGVILPRCDLKRNTA